MQGRMIDLMYKFRGRKLDKTDQSPSFAAGSFSNTENLRIPIQ